MTGTDPRSTVFERRDNLDPPEFPVDDTEPVSVQLARVQLCVALWEEIRRFEAAQRDLDARADAIARRREQNAVQQQLEATGQDAHTVQARAERLYAQRDADRRGRVDLWASQRGLTYCIDTARDQAGRTIERHLLTAPAGHPDLAGPPWKTVRPITYRGQLLVPTVPGETLEAIESWLGLPHDPASSGTPQPSPHPATTGAWSA